MLQSFVKFDQPLLGFLRFVVLSLCVMYISQERKSCNNQKASCKNVQIIPAFLI